MRRRLATLIPMLFLVSMRSAPARSLGLLQRYAAALSQTLQGLRRWVLAEAKPPLLQGQACDRLRPRFLAVALEHKLAAEQLAGAALVDWQWESSTGQVHGLLWRGDQLERFHWLPELEHLVRQPVLALSQNSSLLQLVPAIGVCGQG